jgi:hypothetical protein
LILHETEWPGSKETPYFNHHAFFANLKRYQQENSSEAEEFGNVLMYGEVVTSTNTILEKYVYMPPSEAQLTSSLETPNSSLIYQMVSQLPPPCRWPAEAADPTSGYRQRDP